MDRHACTLWGACSLVAACEPLPTIFSHLSAQGFLSRLFFGEALQLKAMHIAIKPVGADDSKQPVRCYFCDLTQSRSQAFSHTFQTAQAPQVGDHPGRIGALIPSSGSASRVGGIPVKWAPTNDPGLNSRAGADESPYDLFPLLYPLLLALSTCPDKISQQSLQRGCKQANTLKVILVAKSVNLHLIEYRDTCCTMCRAGG